MFLALWMALKCSIRPVCVRLEVVRRHAKQRRGAGTFGGLRQRDRRGRVATARSGDDWHTAVCRCDGSGNDDVRAQQDAYSNWRASNATATHNMDMSKPEIRWGSRAEFIASWASAIPALSRPRSNPIPK